MRPSSRTFRRDQAKGLASRLDVHAIVPGILMLLSVLIVAVAGLVAPLNLQADTPATTTTTTPMAPAPAGVTEYATTSNSEKASALVKTAINLTDSDRALKLLWQATDIDPTLADPYIYLGLYYNSRSDFGKVIQVYQKLVKYQPKESSAYLNIGEAYMSFTPPRTDDALSYYRKALDLDPSSSFAALRMGEIYAQQGNREMAVRYLKLASSDAKNPDVAAEANHYLSQMGAS
jgi:tetratricopeptide (TPR) repeat protein